MHWLSVTKKLSCLNILVVLAVLIISFPVTGSAGVGVDVEVNRNSVEQGDEIMFRAGITGSWDQPVDLYLGLVKPFDSSIYYLGPDLQLTTEKTAVLQGWIPFEIPIVDLYNFVFGQNEVNGDYFWCAVLTYAGQDLFQDGSILPVPGAVSVAQFVKTGSSAGIVDWFPREGAVFNTTEPKIFLGFSRSVDTASVEKRMAVTLTSLSSGKTVTVSHKDNGERWATVVIPGLALSQRIEGNEFISQGWSGDGTRISYQIQSVTLYGQTFALHHGVTYQLTFQLMTGATFADGSSIPGETLGPITFSIE